MKKLFCTLFILGLALLALPNLSFADTEPVFSLKNLLTPDDRGKTISANPQNPTSIDTNLSKNEDTLTSVEVTGNLTIPTEFIMNEIFLKPGDTLNPYKIDRIVQAIKSLGLFAEVTPEIIKEPTGKKLILRLTENQIVKNIEIVGSNAISTPNIINVLRTKQGSLFNTNNIRMDVNNIENLYQQNGYRWAKVLNVITPKETGDSLIYIINEGFLGEIVVSGNTKTQDYVILREMSLKKGSVLKEQSLQEDIRRIYNLNYFSTLTPDLIPATNNSYILLINVNEKSSSSINFGGGYGQTSGAFGFIDLTLDNFMGTGQVYGLKTQVGKSTTFELKYYNPWIMDERKSLGIRLWRTYGLMDYVNPISFDILNRNEDRLGTEITFGWPFSYELKTFFSLKTEAVKPDNADRYKIFSYKFNIAYDNRDFWFNPRKGSYYSFTYEQGIKPTFLGTFFDNSTSFSKFDTDFRWFVPTFENQLIAARLCAGYMIGDLNNKQPYYVGGGNTVRGYEDLHPFGVGNKRIFGNLEYRFLINDMFGIVAFLDCGAASYENVFAVKNYHWGKGLGLRVNTPIGPLRLDYGFGDNGHGVFHFNIGQSF